MRNDQLVRQQRIVERLKDGRARRTGHFEDIRLAAGVGEKTIRRDLEAIARIPELRIHTRSYGGWIWYQAEPPDGAAPYTGPKTCTKCNWLKPIEQFGRNKRNVDGRENQCILCRRAWNHIWAEKNRARINARQRRRREKIRRAN